MRRWAAALLRIRKTSLLVGLGFVVMLGLQGVLIHHGITRLQEIGAAMDGIARVAVPAAQLAQDMQKAAQNRIIYMLRMLAQPDPLEREPDAQVFEREGLAFGAARDGLAALPLDAFERRQMQTLLEHAVLLSRSQRAVVQALLEGRDEDARAQIQAEGVLERQHDLVAALRELAAGMWLRATQTVDHAHRLQSQAEQVVLGLGVSLFILGTVIGAAVTRTTLRAERMLNAEVERNRRAACTDTLTGLHNRRGFEEARKAALADDRCSPPCGLLLLDLDHFKPINDSAGHDAGDAVLQRVADILSNAVRPHDVVARLGGDEFAIFLWDAPAGVVDEVAQRIVTTLGDFTFEWKGQRFRLGASVGAAVFDAATAKDCWTAVLKAADQACYEAKRQGRGRYARAAAAGAWDSPTA
ncbi:MAG: diguanylate cyclase [Tepidimonas sp.]|uniref:diguanylate cyclase domain-containing protein n=1 Tax=Tepidimonas sp. TaxID=2002775 RepID=UPI00259EF0FB|nr:diguanylate cyclase [Tepidimonas sp.]MDM7456227.1 diguanylate cyclase [Tepidimonas sp.]